MKWPRPSRNRHLWLASAVGLGLAVPFLCLSLISSERGSSSSLDGCYHVYLDVGSNVGVQVRKLYQPDLFPRSKIFKTYDQLFGEPSTRRLSEICSVGFEPNPAHSVRLRRIEAAYRRCGYPVSFRTETAVADRDGQADLFTDGRTDHFEWGATTVGSNSNVVGRKASVALVRLAAFIRTEVANRRLPRPVDPHNPPAVLMKMDIEGSELEVLSDLLLSGSLSFLNVSLVEFHEEQAGDQDRRDRLRRLRRGLLLLRNATLGGFNISDVDDEKYHASNFRLPEC